eukprot:860377_1
MNVAANFDVLQNDCSFINQLQAKYLPRFCKLAVKSIIDGENTSQISKAAKSLEQDEDVVKNAVRALAQILTMLASASVYVVAENVFQETLLPMKLNKEALKSIYEYYQSVHSTLRDVLRQFKIETSRYHQFDWRLDVQISSRALHRRVDPVYLCQLQTTTTKPSISANDNAFDSDEKKDSNEQNNNNTSFENTVFECNFANLENMISQFEQALRETKQSWYKKVSRQTK